MSDKFAVFAPDGEILRLSFTMNDKVIDVIRAVKPEFDPLKHTVTIRIGKKSYAELYLEEAFSESSS